MNNHHQHVTLVHTIPIIICESLGIEKLVSFAAGKTVQEKKIGLQQSGDNISKHGKRVADLNRFPNKIFEMF